jgi:hypothetical protein
MKKLILTLSFIGICALYGKAQSLWNSSTQYNIGDHVVIPLTAVNADGSTTTSTYTFVCMLANHNQNPNNVNFDWEWAIDKTTNVLPLVSIYRYVTIGTLATYNGKTYSLSIPDNWPPQLTTSAPIMPVNIWTIYTTPIPLSGWAQWNSSQDYIFNDKVWEIINGTIYYFTCLDKSTTLSNSHDPASSPLYWAVSDIIVLPYLSTLHYNIMGMKATYGGNTYTLNASDAPAQASSNQPPLSTLWSTVSSTPISCFSSINCTAVMGDDGSSYIKSYQTPTVPVIVNQNDITYYYNQVHGSSSLVNLGEIRNPISPLVLNDNDILLRGATDINHGLGYYGSAGNMDISTPKKRNFADTPIDGPVLYGWSGGALGLRQRSDISSQTSFTAEKVALRWDWANVVVGSSYLPMNLNVNGNLTTTGNVSIGLPTALSTLTVNGSSSTTGNVSIGIPTALSTLTVNGNTIATGNVSIGLPTALSTLTVNGSSTTTGNVSIGLPTALSTLTVNGSLGIGTIKPNSLLQIGDDINNSLHFNIPNGVVITANAKNAPGTDRAILELHSPAATSVLDIETTNWGSFIGTLTNVSLGTTLPLYIQQQGGSVVMGDFNKDKPNLVNLEINGSIGIGTTNPSYLSQYKLAVSGGIVAQSMNIIKTVPNSDYVFDKDYKLRTLAETEAYVDKNKHLPEVPSAEEFKKGYSVGTMDDILLRKVEELTLYMIEMQKQNDEIVKQNALLKVKIEKLEKKIR